MSDRIAIARGMRDQIGVDYRGLTQVEEAFRQTLEGYAYEPIRLPTLEQTSLFSRGLGEATDAVSKEMFVFEREKSSLALRPEGTASCVRALISDGIQQGSVRKVSYTGAMFRYERPQKGRYREFYQVGAEAFGLPGPDVDCELIQIVEDVLESLQLRDSVSLEVNSLGNSSCRHRYREALVEYFTPYRDDLDEDSQRRLVDNPMRILDSKNPNVQALVDSAPKVLDYLDDASQEHFNQLCEGLEVRCIDYTINKTLVRGLDYYTHAVFEWNTELLGAQKQVGGGGRYDGLCELLGGPSMPGVGFAMGVDRLALLGQELESEVNQPANVDIYVLALSDDVQDYALMVARSLRNTTALKVQTHFGGGKVKKRMQMADRSGAKFALIIGEEEATRKYATVKWLREDREQSTVPLNQLAALLSNHLNP